MSGTLHRPTNRDEVAEVVRAAVARGTPLRIRGAGTWMDAGLPVRAGEVLALDRLQGIVAYTPADLTITVEAATTLAELDAATRPHGQWCPLLPWGDDAGTVGATVATATTGPFAAQLGQPRDLVLGVDAVDGVGPRIKNSTAPARAPVASLRLKKYRRARTGTARRFWFWYI